MKNAIVALIIALIGIGGCVCDCSPKSPVVSPTEIAPTNSVSVGPMIPAKIPWWVDEQIEEEKCKNCIE